MRRFRQQLPDRQTRQILATATNGILSVVDGGGNPYGVPMSFVYDGRDSIYFHCAREGRKMDCVRRDSRASFCVVETDDVRPDEFTTYFRSVIVSGRVSIVEQHDEMVAALRMLCGKYSPGIDCSDEIEKNIGRVAVLRMSVDAMTGKEAIELVQQR